MFLILCKNTGGDCTTGHYCPAGTGTPEPCVIGTFFNATGAQDANDCYPCTPGKLMLYYLYPGTEQFLNNRLELSPGFLSGSVSPTMLHFLYFSSLCKS